MPTQEERIAALEQKTAAHIQEMDENFTIMVGVIRHQGQDIKRIFQRLETIDESLHTVNQRLDTVDESLLTLKQQSSQFETVLNEHTSLLSQILERLT
jgi:uncharacterized protein YdcH (DUF465 family)